MRRWRRRRRQGPVQVAEPLPALCTPKAVRAPAMMRVAPFRCLACQHPMIVDRIDATTGKVMLMEVPPHMLGHMESEEHFTLIVEDAIERARAELDEIEEDLDA